MSRRKQLAENSGFYDYIIVGAGTAGCLLANRLTASGKHRVLLLEAGGKDDYLWIHIPVGYLYCIDNPRTDWCYKTDPEAGLGGRQIGYARGKVLGGCSSINAMVYMRGQARDYDLWSELGNAGWSWKDVLPYFMRHEDFVHGEDDEHHAGGEWRIEEQRLHWPILDVFRDACVEVGIPATADFNRGNNSGVGYFQVNQRRGVRVNASKAFLRPARNRSNLTVVTHAHAKRILFRCGQATGVAFDQSDTDVIAHLNDGGEVILAAGAIGSPQLLELSGVGQGARLQNYAIPVVLDRHGVGENLQDHLQVRLTYKVSNALTLNHLASKLSGKARIALQYAFLRRGPMSMAPSQLGAFAKSDPSQEMPNLQYHAQPLSLDRFGEPLHRYPAITASVCNLRPASRGSVHLVSPDFRNHPSIRPNYLDHPRDRQVAVDAVRLTRRIMATNAFKPYMPEEVLPGAHLDTDEELALAAGNIATTIFHPVGTARMGQDRNSVVDERLRVHGIDGLRIVDASVMPTITSGNTNAPTLMIAEKGASMILDDRRSAISV
ncbi:GMC family oxidoreductase N-terminal domain-containing protein [Bradyrhizobium sp. Ec3.3]|uniref:GMC family oxidoreductase n=1 Tax=Bradyrhizobium sp. Ec3.3 TaxID=189753 RepID=UPI000552608F